MSSSLQQPSPGPNAPPPETPFRASIGVLLPCSFGERGERVGEQEEPTTESWEGGGEVGDEEEAEGGGGGGEGGGEEGGEIRSWGEEEGVGDRDGRAAVAAWRLLLLSWCGCGVHRAWSFWLLSGDLAGERRKTACSAGREGSQVEARRPRKRVSADRTEVSRRREGKGGLAESAGVQLLLARPVYATYRGLLLSWRTEDASDATTRARFPPSDAVAGAFPSLSRSGIAKACPFRQREGSGGESAARSLRV